MIAGEGDGEMEDAYPDGKATNDEEVLDEY